MTTPTIELKPSASPTSAAERQAILANPGFGRHFTDHMVTIKWTEGRGWHDGQLVPYAPLSLDPATMVLHYAQEIFEGLKAYRQPDGSVATFRPEKNAERFQRSAHRLGMPELPVETFIEACDALVQQDKADPSTTWIRSSLRQAAATGATDAASLQIKPPLATDLVGRRIRLTISARAPDQGIPAPFAVAYSAGDVGSSGWVVFTPGTEFDDYSFEKGTAEYEGHKQYKHLVVKLHDEVGKEVVIRTGSIVERDGQFKFASFIRD